MKPKRLLVIAAGSLQEVVIRRAKSMGLQVVATDRNPDAPGLRAADIPEVADLLDVEGILQIARKHRVDGVVSEQTDAGVVTAARVAEQLGLPGIGVEVALRATNKWLMREACRLAGIPTPAYRRAHTVEEAKAAAAEIGGPVVLKPPDGQGSRGVVKIDRHDDIGLWFCSTLAESRSDYILVEERMFGIESSAEGFVGDGGVRLLAICDKTKCPAPYSYDVQLVYPACFPPEVHEEIRILNQRVVQAIGIPLGITHAEYIVTEKGVRLMEVAARGCGAGVATELIPAMTGVDPIAARIRQALGQDVKLPEPTFHKSGILDFILLPPGRVRTVRGLEAAARIPGVVKIALNVGPGDMIGVIDEGSKRPGFVLAVGEDREEVLTIAQEVKSALKVEMDVAPRRFASRMADLVPSASISIAAKAKEFQRQQRPVVDLSCGEPDAPTPSHILAGAKRALDQGFTKYTPSSGLPDLRKAITSKLKAENGLDYAWDSEILVAPGAKQAILYAMLAFLDPGTEVLLPEPCWLSYASCVAIAGGRAVPVPGIEEYGFKVGRQALLDRVTPRTRMIILNNPTNPTGTVWERSDLQVVAEVACERDLMVIADEIYEKFVYDGKEIVSLASLPGMRERTIVINGFSKTYAMTGFRIGYLAAPSQLIAQISKIHQHSATCASSVSQMAALEALRGSQEAVGAMVREYQRRRDFVFNAFNALRGICCSKPFGTFYAFPNVKTLGTSSLEVSQMFLEKALVAVIPGSAYGQSGEGYVRISFAAPWSDLERAAKSLEEIL